MHLSIFLAVVDWLSNHSGLAAWFAFIVALATFLKKYPPEKHPLKKNANF